MREPAARKAAGGPSAFVFPLPRATQREVKLEGIARQHVVLLDPDVAEPGWVGQRQCEQLAFDTARDAAGEIRSPAIVTLLWAVRTVEETSALTGRG